MSLHFYKVSLLFLLFFPLYSFLQDGRFTTKRQRGSPINLVANHALDSSVDLCLCPSVCIFSFLFLITVAILFLFYLPLFPVSHAFSWTLLGVIPHSTNFLHSFHSYTFSPQPQMLCFYVFLLFWSPEDVITCTYWCFQWKPMSIVSWVQLTKHTPVKSKAVAQDVIAFHPKAILEAWHISVVPAIDESFNSRGMFNRAAASD